VLRWQVRKVKLKYYEDQQKQLDTRGLAGGVGGGMASVTDYPDYQENSTQMQNGAQPAPIIINQPPAVVQKSNPVMDALVFITVATLLVTVIGAAGMHIKGYNPVESAKKGRFVRYDDQD
jgi:hypothetical protein